MSALLGDFSFFNFGHLILGVLSCNADKSVSCCIFRVCTFWSNCLHVGKDSWLYPYCVFTYGLGDWRLSYNPLYADLRALWFSEESESDFFVAPLRWLQPQVSPSVIMSCHHTYGIPFKNLNFFCHVVYTFIEVLN